MLKTHSIPFEKLPFSQRDKDYQKQLSAIEPFISAFPSIDSLIDATRHKTTQSLDRQLLFDVLNHQYQDIDTSQKTTENIAALAQANTYTIITAHQPSLLTGPLYYICKIASIINLCRRLNAGQTEFRYVPVFVSGGEDHDFEEIATTTLFNKPLTWNTNQTGSVGRMTLEGIDTVVAELETLIGERSQALDLVAKLKTYINESKTYNDFQHRLVNELFGEYGLVYLSMDEPRLKAALWTIFEQELTTSFSEKAVLPQQKAINKSLGYDAQAFVRPINLFYQTQDNRIRLERIDDATWQTVDGSHKFSLTDLQNECHNISPNVILRPLCQEYLLPNVAYVGGGGELAYWLDRKQQFVHSDIPYPILIRRNSAGLITERHLSKWENLGFSIDDLTSPNHKLIATFLEKNGDDFSLEQEITDFKSIMESIKSKAGNIQQGLTKSVEAFETKEVKNLEQLQSRLKREVKKQHDNSVNAITKTQEVIFPNGSLQERRNNIFEYLSKYGITLIDEIVDVLDPLDRSFTLLILS